MTLPPDQFYTGLIAHAYAPLRQSVTSPQPYERFVRSAGEPALELGCGHGEPLLDLVAAGLDVTGLDSSADMLERCRDHAARRSLAVRLVCQRMERLDLGTSYAAIYLAGPTFQLVIDLDDASATLRGIASHLRDDGRALVPLFTPRPTPPESYGLWHTHIDPDGRELAFQTVAQSYRARERRVDTALRYRLGPESEPLEIVERDWSLRWYEQGEFEALAADAGLGIVSERTGPDGGRSMILGHIHE